LASCNRSKLTQTEIGQVDAAIHQLNISACKDGIGLCDYSELTPSETRDATAAPAIPLRKQIRRRGPISAEPDEP
jgi:hypothetical protein